MNSPIRIWRRQERLRTQIGKTGTIIAWTEIFVSHDRRVGPVPYPVALVELEDGDRIYGEIVDADPEHITVGAMVKTVLRRYDDGHDPEAAIMYGPKLVIVSSVA